MLLTGPGSGQSISPLSIRMDVAQHWFPDFHVQNSLDEAKVSGPLCCGALVVLRTYNHSYVGAESHGHVYTHIYIWKSGSGQLNSPLSIGRITKFDFHPQIEARFSPLLLSERITDPICSWPGSVAYLGNFGTSWHRSAAQHQKFGLLHSRPMNISYSESLPADVITGSQK